MNGNVCVDATRRLKPNEVVKVYAEPAPAPPSGADLVLTYLDDWVVVVEKPAGVTSLRHTEERNWSARRKQKQPTLDELLPIAILRDEVEGRSSSRRAPPPAYPKVRAVHRIDRDTSGLMVFARTVEAESHLGKQFRDHSIDRRYLAICRGIATEQTIVSRLVDDRGDGRRGSTPSLTAGKEAITHVRPLELLNGYTLVECRLETGRTHQIRIHLSEQGNPLCGDKVYNGPITRPPIPDRSGAPRLALHAADLGFTHPITGKRVQFSTPLPRDLQRLVERLRT